MSYIERETVKDMFNNTLISMAVKSVIDDCPAADVVEVVRCKDCIYYEANSCFNPQWDFESSVEIPLVRDCDFCSYGERKEENEG